MLISDRDICEQPLPLLLVGPNRDWQLVTAIKKADGQFYYQLSRIENEIVVDREVSCSTPPFHVGDNVWELEYGLQIVSIPEPDHPAYELWDHWQTLRRKADHD